MALGHIYFMVLWNSNTFFMWWTTDCVWGTANKNPAPSTWPEEAMHKEPVPAALDEVSKQRSSSQVYWCCYVTAPSKSSWRIYHQSYKFTACRTCELISYAISYNWLVVEWVAEAGQLQSCHDHRCFLISHNPKIELIGEKKLKNW